MRFNYVLSEVFTGLWRNVTMTVAMIITMAVSLLMLGTALLAYKEVDEMQKFYFGKVEVSIFLTDEIAEDQRQSLEGALKGDPLVRQVTYESKDAAYTHFRQMYRSAPDLIEATKADALPASFRIKLKNPTKVKEVTTKYKEYPGVDDIVDQQKLLNKLFNALGAIQNIALFAAIVQGFAALLLVANTIQVAAYSKRREVSVMKLVGASNWFIQMPFVLEAVFAGLIGALLAFLGLVLFKVAVLDGSLKSLVNLFPLISWRYILLELPLLAGIATVVSAVTGWVTLRVYVRV
jgi:cell division transport system permease protein